MHAPRSAALAVSDVTCRLGTRLVLDGVQLTVQSGSITGLLGPNGAGKSSLLRAIAGRLPSASGTVRIDGLAPDAARRGARLGIVPQDIALFPHLSVRENLEVLGRLAGVPAPDLDARVREGLTWAGLADRAATLVPTLSGGMRRRVNLVAGTLHRPALLLLDEPTVGVDREARERLHDLLRSLRSAGMAMVLATHDLAEADELCDDVVVMARGRVVASGTVAEVVTRVLQGRRHWEVRLGTPVPDAATARLTAQGFREAEPGTWMADLARTAVAPDALAHELAALGATVREWRVVEPGLAAAVEALTGGAVEGRAS